MAKHAQENSTSQQACSLNFLTCITIELHNALYFLYYVLYPPFDQNTVSHAMRVQWLHMQPLPDLKTTLGDKSGNIVQNDKKVVD
jgi:hypothetical protein